MAAAQTSTMRQFSFSFYSLVFLCFFFTITSANRQLDESNWRDILEDEWMVEFYAPWCPACNALSPAWKEMGKKASREYPKLKTAEVDVTLSPGLSGRFVVTALPTIFHVKDGEFRQYKGPRDATSMLDFVIQQRWKQTDPIPGWKAPNSIQMTLVAEFFKLSQALRSVHTTLMDTYGLPTWGSYLIFAIATIFIGALLGLLLVCIIDLLYPPKRAAEKILLTKSEVDQMAKGDLDVKERSDDDDEMLNEDIVDDNEEQDSDAERNSPPDTDEDDKEPTKECGDAATENVRRRRPRKDD